MPLYVKTLTTLYLFSAPARHLARRLDDGDDHDRASKSHNSHGKVCLRALLGQLDVTQWRQDKRKRTGRRRPEKLEDDAKIARHEREHQGSHHQRGGEYQMPIRVVVFIREPVVVHDFSAHKGLKRQGCQHVQAKAEARNVDHEIIIRKVVEHIAERLVAKGQVSRKRHE